MITAADADASPEICARRRAFLSPDSARDRQARPRLYGMGDRPDEIRRTFVEKIQCICLELVVDAVAEAGRTDEMKRHRPTQTDAEEPIEAGKMIHVGVRYEGMAHPQEVARRQRRQIAEVEQKRAAAEAEIDE
jgi:hypothetical protein